MVVERASTGGMSWLRTGPDPRILFLHGYSDAAVCWSPLLAALAGRCEALAIDARGHGESGLPEEPFGPQAMAADAAKVLDYLGGKPIVVVGTSMGGLTAAVLAAWRPDLLAGLVLAEPAPGTRVRAAPSMAVPEWLREVKALDRSAKVAKCRADNPHWADEELLPWAVAKEQLNLRLHQLPWEDPVYLPDLLGKVRCPVLLLLGDPAAGSVIDPTIAEACGPVQLVRLRRAGHDVRRDQPAPFLSELTAFLDAI